PLTALAPQRARRYHNCTDRGVLIRAGSHPPTPQVAVVRQAHGSGTCEATGTPRSTGSGYVPVHAWNPNIRPNTKFRLPSPAQRAARASRATALDSPRHT